MDCFISALRESVCRKAQGNGAVESEDAFWGIFKRAFCSSSSYCAEDENQTRQAPSNLKRQRVTAFFVGCYLCGIKVRSTDEKDEEMKTQFSCKEGNLQRKEVPGDEERAMQWWEESSKKRRKLGSNKWIADGGNRILLNGAPAKLKRFLRRLRAKVRKLGQFQKATSFHYDPLSYSMNFDDGCWQHCDSHGKLFYVSSSCNSSYSAKLQSEKAEKSSDSIVKVGARPFLWQRRQVRQPKFLRVTKARAFHL